MIMDFKELGANLGLEEDEFIELVELFASSAADDINRLQTAYENNDAEQAAEAAHSLKGSAGNLGFAEFSEGAKIVEDNSRKNNLDGVDEILVDLKEKLTQITSQLENSDN